MSLRYLSGGESHGPCLTAIIEGFWSGVEISPRNINNELKRRQQGYGRGGRMKIESDKADILSGVRLKKTLGTPITLQIKNRDYENWKEVMDPEGEEDEKSRTLIEEKSVTKPRPGHVDLSGALKYGHKDIRNVLERASARETAVRVAIGGFSKELLNKLNIDISSHVLSIGSVSVNDTVSDDLYEVADDSETRCFDKNITEKMKKEIDLAKERGESLGGTFEIIVDGLPPGIGDYVHWDKKLDGRLSSAIMSIQGVKGVEIGLGFESSRLFGSKVHDEIYYSKSEKSFRRKTNNAGGLEGGVTNGEPLIIRGAMKPIPTLYTPLKSVSLDTKEAFEASVERSDCCAVPACSVIAENVIAWEICKAIKEKFGGDSFEELKRSYEAYLAYLREV